VTLRAGQAGERGDGFGQQGVAAGLLVGGVAGAELSDGAAVPGLGGERADPGGNRRAGERVWLPGASLAGAAGGRRAAGRGMR
jgi:hypothetical protein